MPKTDAKPETRRSLHRPGYLLGVGGKVYAHGKKLIQWDEHEEDEAIHGNSADFATNRYTLAEFRTASDCKVAARMINKAMEDNAGTEPRRE